MAGDSIDEISQMAESALAIVTSRTGKIADFSLTSLQAIEDTLDEAANYWIDLSIDRQNELVEIFGCYILEIGRRQYGGKYYWHDDLSQPILVVGEPDFHIAIAAWNKVRNRLSGDESDCIVFFVRGFADRVRAATPGTRAVYI
jgi:hypothetical protein